jgi:hypothetical protein
MLLPDLAYREVAAIGRAAASACGGHHLLYLGIARFG